MIKSTEDKDRSTEVSVEKFKKSKNLFYHSTEEKEWGTGKVFVDLCLLPTLASFQPLFLKYFASTPLFLFCTVIK